MSKGPEVGKLYRTKTFRAFSTNEDFSVMYDFGTGNCNIPPGSIVLITKAYRLGISVDYHTKNWWKMQVIWGEYVGWVRNVKENWENDFEQFTSK